MDSLKIWIIFRQIFFSRTKNYVEKKTLENSDVINLAVEKHLISVSSDARVITQINKHSLVLYGYFSFSK